jgi:hypothetical protein
MKDSFLKTVLQKSPVFASMVLREDLNGVVVGGCAKVLTFDTPSYV